MNATQERAEQRLVVDAPAARCWEVATNFVAYPEWSEDVTLVEVLDSDEEQRATRVRFDAHALGRSTRYTLAYDYSDAPSVLRWSLVEGDIEKSLHGEYLFEPAGAGTQVTYRLRVELKVGMPGFVRRRAEARILVSALRQLKARAES